MVEIRKEYYDNGILKSEIPYLDDKQNGVTKWYYDNGSIEFEIPFENDERHGIVKYYDENGNLTRERKYVNGVIDEYFNSKLGLE